MPAWTTTADTTTNSLPNVGPQGSQAYMPSPTAASYPPGTVLQLVAIDQQLYPNHLTVQPVPASQTATKIAGVVAGSWSGFSGSIGSASYTSPSNTAGLVRGTQLIEAIVKGYTYVFIDQSGVGAVTVTDGIPLVSSRNTAGYAQGIAVATAATGSLIGVANLPSAGLGSSLTAAALAQATIDFTIATPAAGDIVNTTIQSPYTNVAPGVAQTTTWSYKLTTADAASVTTAALAVLTYLNSQANFSRYFIATQTAGAIHMGVNKLSSPFLVTYTANGTNVAPPQFYIGISGMVANSLTTAGSVTGSGGTTYSAAGATFNSGTPGTGYNGLVPCFVNGEF